MARTKKDQAMRWDQVDKDSTSLERLITIFDAFNKAEGKTLSTIRWYQNSLRMFVDFLIESGIEPVLGNLTAQAGRDYILYLQGRTRHAFHPNIPDRGQPLSPTTIQNYMRAIKAFANWLNEEGYTDENRLARVKQPRAPKKLIQPLSDEELSLIIASMDTQVSWGARNAGIVLLMLDTGLRLGEVAGLEMDNLFLEDGYLKVMGKGQKERLVPFGGSAQKVLMKYVYYFRPEPEGEDRVFLSLEGAPLTNEALRLIFRRLAKNSGVKRVYPHLLRHTFAARYLMNGGDVFTLQQLLGHTTLEMVRRYAQLSDSYVISQHQRFSPLDRVKVRQVNHAASTKNIDPRRGRRRRAFR